MASPNRLQRALNRLNATVTPDIADFFERPQRILEMEIGCQIQQAATSHANAPRGSTQTPFDTNDSQHRAIQQSLLPRNADAIAAVPSPNTQQAPAGRRQQREPFQLIFRANTVNAPAGATYDPPEPPRVRRSWVPSAGVRATDASSSIEAAPVQREASMMDTNASEMEMPRRTRPQRQRQTAADAVSNPPEVHADNFPQTVPRAPGRRQQPPAAVSSLLGAMDPAAETSSEIPPETGRRRRRRHHARRHQHRAERSAAQGTEGAEVELPMRGAQNVGGEPRLRGAARNTAGAYTDTGAQSGIGSLGHWSQQYATLSTTFGGLDMDTDSPSQPPQHTSRGDRRRHDPHSQIPGRQPSDDIDLATPNQRAQRTSGALRQQRSTLDALQPERPNTTYTSPVEESLSASFDQRHVSDPEPQYAAWRTMHRASEAVDDAIANVGQRIGRHVHLVRAGPSVVVEVDATDEHDREADLLQREVWGMENVDGEVRYGLGSAAPRAGPVPAGRRQREGRGGRRA